MIKLISLFLKTIANTDKKEQLEDITIIRYILAQDLKKK